uniref:Uncharacterized protein n=2 Tax=Clastoptera arizonana TaxID=38151 RepID=A0A1B6E9D4_9HEMI
MSESSSIDGKSLAAQRIKEDFGSPERISKRTTRRKSLLDSFKDTPVTPQNKKVDEYMPQRRLTRKQMSYLQNAEHSPNISSSKVEEEKSKNQTEPNVSQPRSLRNSPARSTRASSLSRK